MPRRVCSSSTTLARTRALYRDIDGFDVDDVQERRLEKRHKSLTYGEIMPTAGVRLIEALELRSSDVFFDLGSGVGRLALTAALRSSARRVVGVELLGERHEGARQALGEAVARGWLEPGRVELRNEDILQTALDGATVLYTCSTAFPERLIDALVARITALPRRTRFVTTQKVEEQPRLRRIRTLRLDMSWSRAAGVHIYEAGPGSRAS